MLRRRKPLSRSNPPKRKRGVKRKRKEPRRRPEGYMDDPKYRAWVRSLGVCFVRVWLSQRGHEIQSIPSTPERDDAWADLLADEARAGRYCKRNIEADHQDDADRGLGQKAPPTSCVPMCHRHHMERESWSGFFKRFDKAEMRAFQEAGRTWTQRMRAQHLDPDAVLSKAQGE